ncbi:MAG: aconitate hydratase [Gammaproteobacteria bacterium]|nr:aconitate hydratase [Gammaproteobacteria bacterium]
MPMNVAHKLIHSHLIDGKMEPDSEIGLRVDQTLTQDATGTLVMLELEAMGVKRVKTEVSVQYVDHNLIQEDYKNADDHLFLQSACQKFGLWYSRPGNGVSHPVHMQVFGKPGKMLLGSDSHTCASGSLGMLAIGTGGLEVALAMAGQPYYVKMPKIFGVKLTGKFPDWVSAKDVILEMLRRHSVKGGVGYIIEYHGPALEHLSAMDRHVIANMGAELGATTTVFPSDQNIKRFLKGQNREEEWIELLADEGSTYDKEDEINLSDLEPLIAKPSNPDKVVKVKEVAGEPIYQAYIGSSANPGFRDFAISAEIVRGRKVPSYVSYDVNPTSRSSLEELVSEGYLGDMIHAGARVHQAGCNGCIGMGQAPATGRNSLRTTPRNFPGRSGTPEDSVFLCSPETATASALTGKITDPRDLDMPYPNIVNRDERPFNREMLQSPIAEEQALQVNLIKGPNIASLPSLGPLAKAFEIPILLKVGDNISTDAILPAGARVLPYRSNIPKISEFVYELVDPSYARRAKELSAVKGHIIVGGENYGQGSSREHAALAPRYLGLQMVIAKSFARIHWQNLINFGILPAQFMAPGVYNEIEKEEVIQLADIDSFLKNGKAMLQIKNTNKEFEVKHTLSERQIEIVKAGGLINWIREQPQ